MTSVAVTVMGDASWHPLSGLGISQGISIFISASDFILFYFLSLVLWNTKRKNHIGSE